MRAGKNDQPVFFEAPTSVNVEGQLSTTWADQSGNSPATPDWAMVISQKGAEAFAAASTRSDETIRARIRYRTDLKTTWRMKWMDQYYNILSVDRSQRRAGELWLTAELVGVT